MDFLGNTALHQIPQYLRGMIHPEVNNVIDIWNTALFRGNKMRHISVEEFMRDVDSKVEFVDANWRKYISGRYGV